MRTQSEDFGHPLIVRIPARREKKETRRKPQHPEQGLRVPSGCQDSVKKKEGPIPNTQHLTPNTRSHGFVLVQALIVIAGLLGLLALLVANQRVSVQTIQQNLRQRRAEVAAESALNVALATLQTADRNRVTLSDPWAILGENGTQSFELGEATYRLQILDAGSRLNVNTITEQELQRLPLTQEQIDSLLDWREATVQPRAQGAKDDYYQSLPQPYNAKLAPLTTLNELLLVRGWTAQTLLDLEQGAEGTTAAPLVDANGNTLSLIEVLTVESGMPNTTADGTPRTNISQGNLNPALLIQVGIPPDVAQQIVQNAPYSSLQQLLAQPGIPAFVIEELLNQITVTPLNRLAGTVNINTAPPAVLETVLGLSPDVASTIAAQQTTGFTTLGEVATLPGVNGPQLAQIADRIGIGSDTWIVRVYGESGGVGVALEALVGWRNEQMVILNLEHWNNPTVPAWWNWQENAGTGLSTQ